MKNSFIPIFVNPIFVFLGTWLTVLIFLSFFNSSLDLGNDSLHIRTYIYILVASFIWAVGCIIGKKTAILFRNTKINIPSPSFKTVKKALPLIVSIIILFKILDVYFVTNVTSLSVENLNEYRFRLTELSQSQAFPFINFFNGLMFFLPALISSLAKELRKKIYKSPLFAFLIFSYLIFIYLSTSRSSFFLSFLVLFFFFAFNRISLSKVLIFIAVIVIAFFLIGSIVGKGGDLKEILIYLFGPTLAFDKILNNPNLLDYELLLFRPFHSLLYKIGLMSSQFHLLEYINVPFPINVYTVFGVYYTDLGFIGSIIFLFIIAFFSGFFVFYAILCNSLRLKIYSSFLLSFIVLGVFYDYYTSSGFFFILPILILLFVPKIGVNK